MATASGSGSSSQTKTAQKTWEMANQITPEEEIYKFDRNQHQSILSAKPWSKDPHFFKDIKISALALLKMVMHARYTHVTKELRVRFWQKTDMNLYTLLYPKAK